MKLAEKTISTSTCLRMKSGIKVNLNIITHGDGSKSLVIEKDNHKLIFQQNEMAEFITLFNDFLKSI